MSSKIKWHIRITKLVRLTETGRVTKKKYEKALTVFLKEYNCTLDPSYAGMYYQTALMCDEEDFLIIRLKHPELISTLYFI